MYLGKLKTIPLYATFPLKHLSNHILSVCYPTINCCLFRAVYSTQALIGSRCGFGGLLDGPDLSPLLSHGSLIGRILVGKKRSAWKSIEIAAKLTNFADILSELRSLVLSASCALCAPCVAAHPWRSQQTRRAAFNLKFKCKCKQVLAAREQDKQVLNWRQSH